MFFLMKFQDNRFAVLLVITLKMFHTNFSKFPLELQPGFIDKCVE